MENSQSSTASTIPYELILNCDSEFIQELEQVENLYFANNEISEVIHVEPEPNNDSDDCDELSDSEQLDCTSNSRYDRESENQDSFLTKGCGCKKHKNAPCTSVLDRDILISYRHSMLEKSRQELDLIIKAQIFQHRASGKDGQRSRQRYYFAGVEVCRALFSFAHGVCRNTVNAIGRSLDTHGLEERVHGNVNSVPKHALTLEEVKAVKSFLGHYATQNGVPLPGRTAHHRNLKAILLPSDKNKTDIFNLYCEAFNSVGGRMISLKTFYRLWQEHCPNIMLMQPASDLCVKCKKHSQQIVNSGNRTEEEKQEQLALYQIHLEKVQCQRNHYRNDVENGKNAFECLPAENRLRGQVPSTTPVVYSFDYAQQVMYPHYAQQVGPMFFKTPRKCQCFGVCCESTGTQIFYLLDEGQGAGKGANGVSSMLHHHFQVHGFGEQNVKMNMDNCSGQNKNNTVLGYFLWRTMTGANNRVEISLMEAGHTKFGPDWHFGLWKVRWRHSQAETMNDIQDTVRISSRSGHNIPQLIDDPHNPVTFYDWKSFCKQIFRPIPNITKYHYFRMEKEEPGKVFMKEYMFSEEVVFKATKPSITVSGFPDRIEPTGLDPARQWYLFDEIGPLCHSSAVACPRPTAPRPRAYKSEGVTSK